MGLDEKVIVFIQVCVCGQTVPTHMLEVMRYTRDVCPARAEVLIASRKTPEQSHDLTELPSDVRNQLVSARSETDEIETEFSF